MHYRLLRPSHQSLPRNSSWIGQCTTDQKANANPYCLTRRPEVYGKCLHSYRCSLNRKKEYLAATLSILIAKFPS